MPIVNLYFDARRHAGDGTSLVKIAIRAHNTTAYISTDIRLLPSQWDNTARQVINHPARQRLNAYLEHRKAEVRELVYHHGDLTAQQLKAIVMQEFDPKPQPTDLIEPLFLTFLGQKTRGTHRVYLNTYRHLQGFLGDGLHTITFNDVTKVWLTQFDNYLARTCKKNSRNIHLRNLRAVFNEAIDQELTTNYPFRRFSIRPEPTPKRSLTVEELRLLFSQPDSEYLDMFKLIFFLIGINFTDLYHLKRITRGRIEYNRAKTNRLYSIKVEPEALDIINRHRGKDRLLDIADRVSEPRNYLHRINDALKKIGNYKRVGRGGKKVYEPLFPQLTTYWARHSWATIAAELDIPKETIAAALGHSIGNPTTSIYIDFNLTKVDEANRRVIDYVLYDKR